ncbi:MAG: potassium channel protein [Thermovibrio sp.]|nr:MAG: potassium channel protein [Thermovibrio sp.]
MKFRAPLIIALVTVMASTIGYMVISGVDLLRAFYMTVLTVTTIGYGEMWDMTNRDRVFNLFVMVIGVGAVMGYSLAVLIDLVSSGELIKILRFRKMVGDISALKGHYLIFGFNDYVTELIFELRKNSIPVVVISDDDKLEEFAEEHQIRYYLKLDPTKENTVYLANVKSAVGAIVATDNDYKNLAVTLTVKNVVNKENIYPFFILGIAKNSEFSEKLKLVGADFVETIPSIVSKRISVLAKKPPIFGEKSLLEEILFGEHVFIDIEEFMVQPNSPLVGKSLKELKLKNKFGITIIAIRKRDGRVIYTPNSDTVIEALDLLVVVAPAERIKRVIKVLSKGGVTSRSSILRKKLKERLEG